MKSKLKLRVAVLFLSIFGLIISVYLAFQHYSIAPSSFCDFGGPVSCSLINKSVYSEIFGIPVAVFGVFWFVVSFLLSWLALRKNPKAPRLLLVWSSIGALFVIYLIYLEFILHAVCPFCFLVQAIVFSTLVMSFVMVQKQ